MRVSVILHKKTPCRLLKMVTCPIVLLLQHLVMVGEFFKRIRNISEGKGNWKKKFFFLIFICNSVSYTLLKKWSGLFIYLYLVLPSNCSTKYKNKRYIFRRKFVQNFLFKSI